jgi:hypothetical protein
MGIFWNPCLVYPRDHTGQYQEFEGKIVKSSVCGERLVQVTLEVEGIGELSGYWRTLSDTTKSLPPIGGTACIRVYDAGGGWYPDNKIMSWSRR